MLFFACQAVLPGLARAEISGDSSINRCEIKSYTISIVNDSGNDISGLVVVAGLEDLTGFSYASGTTRMDLNGGGAICTADPVLAGGYSGICAPDPAPPYLTWEIDDLCPGSPITLNNGDTLNLTFNLETDCTAVSGKLNTCIDYNNAGNRECDNTGALNIQVNPGDAAIKMTPNLIPREVGQDVTWTLTVENTGSGVIKNVEVTNVLEAGLAYASSTGNGYNSGQTTTWTSTELPALASMSPGDSVTMDITAIVIGCENLDTFSDVRFGCAPSPVSTCFNTATDGGTAWASAQHISKTPVIEFSPSDVGLTYCNGTENISFTLSNTGDGIAYDVWITVDFSGFTVFNVSEGAVYNSAENRFELEAPLAGSGDPHDSYTLSFDLTYTDDWCGGTFPSGDLLWQKQYKDACSREFFSPGELSSITFPASSSSLSVNQGNAPVVISIGDSLTYTINSSYTGPANCGSGTTGEVQVIDTLPDGVTVTNDGGGVWEPGGGGTGGTITWTYAPPDVFSEKSITVQAPDSSQCAAYCGTALTNEVTAHVIDCCGCALDASDSQTTTIECSEGITVHKTSSSPTEHCHDTTYTNTYTFPAGSSVLLADLKFTEHAELQQQYSGNLSILSGADNVTGSVAVDDTTPGGSLTLDFSGCAEISLAGKTVTIIYDLTATEDTVTGCGGGTFSSKSSLDIGGSSSECLDQGIVHKTTEVSVISPAMSLDINGLGQVVTACEASTITMTLTQTSSNADPKDVKLVLSGLNYYVSNPGFAVCNGDVSPLSCTPVIDGSGDYTWTFNDAFTGSGTSASITLDVRKRCTGGSELNAAVYYDDACSDDITPDETCSVDVSETPALLLKGDLMIEMTPETYHADDTMVQWEIYLTNRGTGTAYNVWVDDVLGSGLLYEHGVNPIVVDNMTGVTTYDTLDHSGSAINGASVSIESMAPGERRQITFIARMIDCSNLTSGVTANWGCIGFDCQTDVTDASIVNLPAPDLINTTTINQLNACGSAEGNITLRNAGQTAVYRPQVAETLPQGLIYISGTTRWRSNGGAWAGPDAAYDPNPAVSPLVWTYSEIPGLASIDSGNTIEIQFDTEADTSFSGGTVSCSARYENPCGDVFNTSDSNVSSAFNEPDITVSMTRIDEPVGCNDAVSWNIDVTNNSGYTLPVIWVEDTLGTAYTVTGHAGDGTYSVDNGTRNGQKVQWELTNVGNGATATLGIDATTDSSPCSSDLNSTVNAWWGCGTTDGSSSTKPGMDPPDGITASLNTSGVQDIRTETREPSLNILSVTMTPGGIDSCDGSSQVTFFLENSGPTDANDLDLVITLPPGLTYNSGTSESGISVDQTGATAGLGAIGNPSVAGSVLTWFDIGDKADDIADALQAGGGNDTLALRFDVQSACYTTADLTLDVYYYDCCGDTRHTVNSTRQLTALSPDLSIAQTPVSSQVGCGTDQSWTITVTNNGTSNAQVVRIEDTPGSWIDIRTGQAGDPKEVRTGVYGWEINNLAAGASADFTIVGTLNPVGFPGQDGCSIDVYRQNNVTAVWGCGSSGHAVDGDPATISYDCEDSAPVTAAAAILDMPDLVITSIVPQISAADDGSVSGSIDVTVQNTGTGAASGAFTVQIEDGEGWTGTGTCSSSVASTATATVSIDASSWNPSCLPGGFTFTGTADVTDDICECDETNNTFSHAYTPAIPDLTITDIDFTTISCSSDGISGEVRVTVSNTGQAAAADFQVSLATDGCLDFSDATVASLDAGAYTAVTFNIEGPWADCSLPECLFTAAADCNNNVPEYDGTNNSIDVPYSSRIPDLVVTDIDFNLSCQGGDSISGDVTVTIENQGLGEAGDFDVALETDGCFDAPSNLTITGPLVSGASASVTFSLTDYQACSDGKCLFTATADPADAICECDGANNTRSETNPPFQTRIYWSDTSARVLQQSDRGGGSIETVADASDGLEEPRGMAVDETLARVYWVDGTAGTIHRADLDGLNDQEVLTGLTSPVDIALDPTGGKMYWSDNGDNAIYKADFNGTNPETVVSGLASVGGLALDAGTGKLYWTNPQGGEIRRADLDGGNQELLAGSGLSSPFGIALDSTGSRMYFSDQTTGKIQRSGLNTINIEDVVDGLATPVKFLDLDETGHVIYFATGSGSIRSVNFDGSGLQDLVTGLTGVFGVGIYTPPAGDSLVNLEVNDITIDVQCGSSTPFPGLVTVNVGNTGLTDARDAVVRLTSDCGTVFTDQIVDLDSGETQNVVFNYTTNGTDCTFTATIDPDNAVCECQALNHTASQSQSLSFSDLRITDIAFDTACTDDSITGDVTVTVENHGLSTAENFIIALDTDGCLEFSSQSVGSLAAGLSTTAAFAITGSWADCTVGQCLFTATLEPDSSCSYADYSETFSQTMPDLVITSIVPQISVAGDGSFSGSIDVTVQNTGAGTSSGAFTVQIEDGEGWTGTGACSSSVASAAATTVSIDAGSWNPSCLPGGCTLTGTADVNHDICECDKTNNTFSRTYIPAIPDLTITDIDFTTISCSSDGISGEVRVTVSNTGQGAAADFQVSLTTDGCLDFSSATVASLDAGADTAVTFNIEGPWADCSLPECLFTAVADCNNNVPECDGTNNSVDASYSSEVPDLAVTDIDVGNLDCNGGGAAPGFVTVSVLNQGFGPADDVRVSLDADGSLVFDDQSISLAAGACSTLTFFVTGPWDYSEGCRQTFTAVINSGYTVCECNTANNQLTTSLPKISGSISDGTSPVAGVTLTFSHDDSTVTTDGDGTFARFVPEKTTTTVTPSFHQFTFTPANRSFADITSDKEGADFLLNDDGDGIPATEEFGPDGDDPGYDGNNDGQPDAAQKNVISMHTWDGSEYVTFSCPEDGSTMSVTAIANPSPGDCPVDVLFSFGFFDIDITGIAPGDSYTVTLYLSQGAVMEHYWKYGPTPADTTPHWYKFMFDGSAGAVIEGNVVTLYFTDGSRGDDDLTANGVISDDGGPSIFSADIPALGEWGLLVILMLLACVSIYSVHTRRPFTRI